MTNDELADGLLRGDHTPENPQRFPKLSRNHALAIIAYLQQHNDFARRVRDAMADNCLDDIEKMDILQEICDEELGNG